MIKRLLSIFLSLCMILTMLPLSVMAQETSTNNGEMGEIIAFEPLEETEITATIGTFIEDLDLPETLIVTVVQSDTNQQTVTEEVYSSAYEHVQIDIPVTWASQPEYDMDIKGEYVFSPVIEDYTIRSDLPEIKVTVSELLPTTVALGMVSPLAGDTYNIWVGGVQVTDANRGNITGAGISGTVSYNSGTNTLTLNGADITANHSDSNGTYGIYANQALNIVLEGDNKVTAANISEKGSVAISIANNPLVIDGSGSLTARGGMVSGVINYGSFGIAANGLTINSGTVVANAGTVPEFFGNLSYGIYSSGTLKFNGGTITATGNNRSINKAPDLSEYTDLQATASENVSGTPMVSYNGVSVDSYKYLRYEPTPASTDVAQIGLTKYVTLQEAIDAVEDGQTIQLLKNINLTTTVNIANNNNKSFTLYLNDKTLDGGSNIAITHKGTGALTIQGNGRVQSNNNDTFEGAIYNQSTGRIIISGATIQGNARGIFNNTKGTIMVSSGTIQSNQVGIFNLSSGTIIVSGGIVIGNRGIFNNSGGFVNVSGGTVQSTGDNAIYTNEGGNITISGDAHITSTNVSTDDATISLWFSNDSRPITLTINGGTIENIAGVNAISKRGNSNGKLIANISIPNGKSALVKGGGHAMNFAPTLVRATVTASESISGTPVVDYRASDIQKYKYLNFEPGPDATITNLNLTSKLTAPATGGMPATAITDDQYTGTIVWSDNPTMFLGNTVYTATITLTAKDGYTFSGVAENAFSYDGATSVTNSIGSDQIMTVTVMFPKTMARTLQQIIITTPPTKTTYYYGETFDKTGMIVKASYDDGTRDENFTDYTVDRTEPLTLSDSLITLTANGTSIKTTQAITVIKKTPTIPTTPTTPDLVYDSTAVDYENNSHVIVIPPAADKPNDPTQGEIKVPGTADGKGNITVNITNKTVTDAFDKALADAKKNGNEQNGIAVVLRVDTGNKTGFNVTVNLPKTVQDTIINRKIINTIVVVDNPDLRVGMDLATVQEINKQAKSDVNITATRRDSDKLTGDAKKSIGSRPVFDLKVNYGRGKQVQRFGAGSVSVTIPYTLGANEKAENVQAVYVDGNGKVHWLTNSVYDSVAQVLRFATSHFSTYGIGYKQSGLTFTDITGHWAKEDIEFVVNRGLFTGTSATTFSPNTAVTRGMFVTALGRLANADVSGYTKSSFTDVKSDAYYMGYIEWASKNSIIKGTGNGKFAPDQSITREQMAVIMENYAKVIGFTMAKAHGENTFADSTKISVYAKDAVNQMQMAGVICGKNGNLFDPQGTATRAEVAAVLRRFVELEI